MKTLKNSVRECPICGGGKSEVLRTQRFVLPEGHPLIQGYDVVCCGGCGFVYADTDVPQYKYDAFYADFSKYQDRSTATGGGDTQWDAERLRQTAADVASFLPNKDARVLDIGCANGGLLQAMRNLGYPNTHGLDPSPTCVRNVTSKGMTASAGSLFSLPDGWHEFDCVILSHVLEHIRELSDAIKNLGAVVGRDGLVYIEVPDASRYAEFLTAPFQDFNTEHINHFSPQGLVNALSTAGWKCQAVQQKVILSAPRMPYPAVFAVARRAPAVPWKPDMKLRECIVDYIGRSQVVLDRIDALLRRELPKKGGVIVWGTGQLAMKLLVETSLRDSRITAFVDGNPMNQGQILRGVPVLAPAQVGRCADHIVVATVIHQEEVLRSIRVQYQLSNRVVLLSN
jgi:SAM-dependent methyltransferase